MSKIVYHVVRHENGWAYKLGDVFSETFATHQAALGAAKRAAAEQQLGGGDTTIQWEDADGKWHEEVSRGDDRPEAAVEDDV